MYIGVSSHLISFPSRTHIRAFVLPQPHQRLRRTTTNASNHTPPPPLTKLEEKKKDRADHITKQTTTVNEEGEMMLGKKSTCFCYPYKQNISQPASPSVSQSFRPDSRVDSGGDVGNESECFSGGTCLDSIPFSGAETRVVKRIPTITRTFHYGRVEQQTHVGLFAAQEGDLERRTDWLAWLGSALLGRSLMELHSTNKTSSHHTTERSKTQQAVCSLIELVLHRILFPSRCWSLAAAVPQIE